MEMLPLRHDPGVVLATPGLTPLGVRPYESIVWSFLFKLVIRASKPFFRMTV